MTKKLTKKQLKERSRKGREARLARKEASLADIAREGCIKYLKLIGVEAGQETNYAEIRKFENAFLSKVNALRPYQAETVALMMDALFDTVLTKEEKGEFSTFQEKVDLVNSYKLTRAAS